KKLLGPSFYFKRNYIIIGDDNRAGIEVMGSHRRNHETRSLRKHNRPPAAQRISGRSGWSRDNQPIGPISIQKLPIEVGMDADHRTRILAMKGKFIERVIGSIKKGLTGI